MEIQMSIWSTLFPSSETWIRHYFPRKYGSKWPISSKLYGEKAWKNSDSDARSFTTLVAQGLSGVLAPEKSVFTNCRISDTGYHFYKILVVTLFICCFFISLAWYISPAKHSKTQTTTLTVNIPLGQIAEAK